MLTSAGGGRQPPLTLAQAFQIVEGRLRDGDLIGAARAAGELAGDDTLSDDVRGQMRALHLEMRFLHAVLGSAGGDSSPAR